MREARSTLLVRAVNFRIIVLEVKLFITAALAMKLPFT